MQLHIFQTDAVEEVHSDRVIVNCGYISTAIYVAACVFVFKCVFISVLVCGVQDGTLFLSR